MRRRWRGQPETSRQHRDTQIGGRLEECEPFTPFAWKRHALAVRGRVVHREQFEANAEAQPSLEAWRCAARRRLVDRLLRRWFRRRLLAIGPYLHGPLPLR